MTGIITLHDSGTLDKYSHAMDEHKQKSVAKRGGTSARRGEILGLKWDKADFDGGFVFAQDNGKPVHPEQRLTSCDDIAEHRSIFITSTTGGGKTYMACAFGI